MLVLWLLLASLGADDEVDLNEWLPSRTMPSAKGIFSFNQNPSDGSTVTEWVSGKVFKRAELPFQVSAVAQNGNGFLFGDSTGQFHWTDRTFTEVAKIDGVTTNGITELFPKNDAEFIAINDRHQKLVVDISRRRCQLIKNYSSDRFLEGKKVLYNRLHDSVYLTNKEGVSIDSKYGITNIIPMDGDRIASLRLTEDNKSLCLLSYRGGNRFGPILEKSVRYFDAQTGKESANLSIVTPNDVNSIVPADESRFGAFTSKGKDLYFEIFKESHGAYRCVHRTKLDADRFCGRIVGFLYSRPIYFLSSQYVCDNQFMLNCKPRIFLSIP